MKRVCALMAFLMIIFLTACGGRAAPSPYSGPATPSQGAEVVIEGFAFQPATLTITSGTTVTWINQDPVAHNIAIAGTESPRLNKGDSWSYTFDTAGTFDYICGLHPSMKGQIIVE
jgi:plastocyanin